MKTIIAKHAHSIVAAIFLAVMVAGPICALAGVIISSVNVNFARLIGAALRLV
jgi:hypothetical protein